MSSVYKFAFGFTHSLSNASLTPHEVHNQHIRSHQIVLVPLGTMAFFIGSLLVSMYLLGLVQTTWRKGQAFKQQHLSTKVDPENEFELEQESASAVLKELLDLGWVLPFSMLCGVIAGIHAVNLDPSGNCAPLQMEDDTGLKYVATLLSFLILFRFNQLYGRVVAARGHIESSIASLKSIAVLVAGMARPKTALWIREEELRTVIAHRLLYIYAMLVFALRGEGFPADDRIQNLQDSKSKESIKDATTKADLKSALYEETALLDTDFQDLVDAGMINGSPAQYGQLIGKVSQLIQSIAATEGCIDIFPGMIPYPRLITFMGRLILLGFCVCASAVVGCSTPFTSFIIAQVYAFFIALAYCGLFKLSSAMENPYGHDLMDFTLDHYGVSLAFDVAKVLQLKPSHFPGFPVTDIRFPLLDNRQAPVSTAGVPEKEAARSHVLEWSKELQKQSLGETNENNVPVLFTPPAIGQQRRP